MERIRQGRWWWAMASVLVLAGAARADDPIPACRLGLELRNALGFGPKVLAALGVDAATYDPIALAATSFCEEHRATIEPLLEAVRDARQDAFRQYELNSDQIETADEVLLTAIGVLAAQSGDIVGLMDGYLSSEQSTTRAYLAEHPLLDPTLALLDLTTEQYNELLTAQRDRDLVFKHHQQRKDLVLVKDAYDAFEAAVAQILTPDQQAAYSDFTDAMLQNLVPLMTEEDTLCPR